jgi:crotonobetainyl-CoA:carnitine CoA-transferase CaiB-like acyl-CoA transferase
MAAPAPLSGVRVLDVSRVLAGPYCTMVLADLGAEVIKVERPGVGDETRGWGPPFAGGEAGYFLSINRGKRSLALDLAHPDVGPVLKTLIARADVVIENFRPGVAARLGLDYQSVKAINPDLVHCSITGFGSGREPAARAGYDFTVQAESGLMSITGEPDGGPAKVGVAVVDVLTGLHASSGILAALHGGTGRHIEVSLLDSALASLINVAQGTLITGQEAARFGNAHPSIVPYEPFRAADGWVAVAAANDSLWQALCRALERSDLASDERLTANEGRVHHRDELVAALNDTFGQHPVEHWLERLEAQGVPAGKIRGVHEAIAAAADAGRPATVEVEHPSAGTLNLIASPIRLDDAPSEPPQAPPLLGQHTREILAEAGLDADALIAAGVAAAAQ